jgi:hypothetical protein
VDNSPNNDGPTSHSEPPNGEAEVSVASRKRALLAGLAAAPAVVTLLSRSVFAQTATPSVLASIAAGTSLHQQPVAGPTPTQQLAQPTQQLDTQPTQLRGDIRRPVR